MTRLVVLLALFFPASAGASFVFFQTPSHNIGCVYSSSPASLRCDIRSGLRPRPPRPGNCDVDWGDSYGLGATGRATITCHGDTAIDRNSRILRYGSTWKRGARSGGRQHKIRLYTATRLSELFADAGLVVEQAFDGFHDRPLGRTSSEMLLVARKE